jgi:hypothetical protein
MALILRILSHADPLRPGKGNVAHRLHQLGVHTEEEGMAEVGIARGVEHLGQRVLV